MPAVSCLRCSKGGYTSPRITVAIPTSLQAEGVVPPIVSVEPELCADCRAKAARENAEAKDRSSQRGEAG